MTWKQKILTSAFVVALVALDACAVKPVQIITKSLPAGQNGVVYSPQTVRVKFGTKPYAWDCAPAGCAALPTGLSLDPATGIISGTPTVNGTFNFVVHIVDSAGTPTTDDQSLYIIISGSAPAPSPSVSITTTSVPNGVVGGAYSTTFQATGGTGPYTWERTVGNFPPAAALVGDTLAGTLSAAGTYSFSVRVTDSSPTPQIFDRAFAATIAAGGTYLFSDGFESANFSAWTGGLSSWQPTVQSGTKRTGTYAMQAHYVLCGVSTNPACGGVHQDANIYANRNLSTSLNHIFLRGYLYLKTPEVGGTRDGPQRKFYWFAPQSNAWSIFLTTDSVTSNPGALYFRLGSQSNATCGITPRSVTFVAKTGYYDTWRSIEIEILLNTPTVANGEARLWLDGVLQPNVFTNWDFRGSCTSNIEYFSVGRQTDRYNYNVIDEYRFWDDIVANTTGPIGP